MKILIAPQDKWQELSNNLIVICQYNSKDNNEVVYGIDYSFKSQYPDFEEVEALSQEDTFWHEEDKSIQIVQNKSGVVWGAMNEPQIAMGLAMHRINTNMQTYEEGDKLYFYANTILPEHQSIFDAYPQLEISINEK